MSAIAKRADGEHSTALMLGVFGNRFTQRVSVGTPGAKYRQYPKNGGMVDLAEFHYENVEGYISKMEVKYNKAGTYKQLVVTVVNQGESSVIFIYVNSAYFTTFVRRLPNVDLADSVLIYPYDWVPPNGSRKIGIGIKQNNVKLADYYWDPNENCRINLPESKVHYDEMTPGEREDYFENQTNFLIATVEALNETISPKISSQSSPRSMTDDEVEDHFEKMSTNKNKPKL